MFHPLLSCTLVLLVGGLGLACTGEREIQTQPAEGPQPGWYMPDEGEATVFAIELIACPMNDLWIRDTGPSFVVDGAREGGLGLAFQRLGRGQEFELDAGIARFVAGASQVPTIVCDLVQEGGCFEVEWRGTAIMTESCILSDNRNPGKSRAQVEGELRRRLGLEGIIWLEGIKGQDITDGHTDFYARFTKPGTLVVSREMDPETYDYGVTRQNIELLEKADGEARAKLQKLFPEQVIEALQVDGIASGGGSIHCATQQEPESKR